MRNSHHDYLGSVMPGKVGQRFARSKAATNYGGLTDADTPSDL